MAPARSSTKRPSVLVFDDYTKISKHVASRIANVIGNNRNAGKKTVLGLATGSSPLGVYRELIKMQRDHAIDFAECVFFNLDEYAGVSEWELQSYSRFMKENLFDYIGVREEQINIPDGTIVKKGEDEVREFCEEYEAKIKGLGGVDLQLLGIGRNGHIGFNEPGSPLESRTRVVELSESTRKDAAPDFFGLKNVPNQAITMGIGTILDAREIVLMVSGEHKAAILKSALEGPPNQQVPASFLQYHDSVEVICDRSGASLLIEYTSPWLVRDIDWRSDENMASSATIWLARRKRKSLADLTPEDFKAEHLGSLVSAYGAGFGEKLLTECEFKVNSLERLLSGGSGKKARNVLILSPHPDDDVICTGATMKKLAEAGTVVNVAYMVSGSNAVKDADVLTYLALSNEEVSRIVSECAKAKSLDYGVAVRLLVQSIYKKQRGMPDEPVIRKIKAEIRRQEALRASSKAGARAFFLNLPFYEEYGSARKAPISGEDVDIVRGFLLKVKPEAIFVAGDTTDPNGTHSMCLDAFRSAFAGLEEGARESEEREYSKVHDGIPVVQYRGAWQEFTLEEADAIEVFGTPFLEAKIEMILEHVSQLDPLFPGPYDDRQFWERARDRNKAFVEYSKKIGMSLEGIAAEVYKKSDLK